MSFWPAADTVRPIFLVTCSDPIIRSKPPATTGSSALECVSEDRGQKENLWGSNRIMFLQNRVVCNSNFLSLMLTQKQCGSISSVGKGGGGSLEHEEATRLDIMGK